MAQHDGKCEGMEGTLRELKRFFSFEENRRKKILFYGPPGCGKSFFSRFLASNPSELKPFLSCVYENIPNLISRNHFEVENVETWLDPLFEEAKKKVPCVFFLDDLDCSIVGGFEPPEKAVRITESFLEKSIEMNEEIWMVGITNRPDCIKGNVGKGGFEVLVPFLPLSLEGRKSLLKNQLENVEMENGLDIHKLAEMTEGFTVADIVSICRGAAMSLIREAVDKNGIENLEEKDVGKLEERHLVEAARFGRSVSENDVKQYEAFTHSLSPMSGYQHLFEPRQQIE